MFDVAECHVLDLDAFICIYVCVCVCVHVCVCMCVCVCVCVCVWTQMWLSTTFYSVPLKTMLNRGTCVKIVAVSLLALAAQHFARLL